MPSKARVDVMERVRLGVTGAGMGAIAGFALWTFSAADKMEGFWIIVIWTLLGVTFAVGAPLMLRSFRAVLSPLGISSVNLKLPGVGDATVALGNPQRDAARRIFFEMTTRTVIQPLDQEDGTIQAALRSLYEFFQSVRQEIKSMPPTPPNVHDGAETLESIANSMLNLAIRPFTSRWHPRLDAWLEAGFAEHEWPLASDCRKDLDQMRWIATQFARALGEAAGVPRLDKLAPDFEKPETASALPEALARYDQWFQASASPELRTAAWRVSLELSALATQLRQDAAVSGRLAVRSTAYSLRRNMGRGVLGREEAPVEAVTKEANAQLSSLLVQLEKGEIDSIAAATAKLDQCARGFEDVARAGEFPALGGGEPEGH